MDSMTRLKVQMSSTQYSGLWLAADKKSRSGNFHINVSPVLQPVGITRCARPKE